MIDKKTLSERDICTKFITPAVEKSGWNRLTQLLEEVSFTDGKIYVRGKLTARGNQKRADYILYYKPNIPIAIIEAKDNKHSVRAGIQQALDYAQILDIPCIFSSNGDGFLFHDRTATDGNIESDIAWKVNIKTIIERGYDLDIKNPTKPEEEQEYNSAELMEMLSASFEKSQTLLNQLKRAVE